MVCAASVRISKYFGGASIQQSVMTLDEAKSNLKYFFTREGGSNIIISVEGRELQTIEDLEEIANQPKYQVSSFIDVGLYLSNDGTRSIWPKKFNP